MIKVDCNIQFEQLLKSNKRFRVHQGGTRSGKTYACVQFLAYLLRSAEEPLIISIIRKTLPALKGSVQRDFIQVMEQLGMYYQGTHNKAENTFKFKDHIVEFLSVDEPQKIRGRKRNIAYLNEANELNLEDFRQINMRTTDFIIMDFNPSDPIHWIYDEIIPREDCDTWITTYKDNKFLSPELVKEIERMKERDPDYWRVYGEGLQATFTKRQIYTNWEFIPGEDMPDFDNPIIGLDFGYSNDPSAAVLVQKKNDKLYIKELLYKTGMTNQDLANWFKANGYDQTLIYADAAEPKSIEEMKQMGLWCKPAKKGQGSIMAGISHIKEYDIFVSQDSKNLYKEYNNYYWEELKDGTIINKPKDAFNHLQDALRYAVYSEYSNRIDFFVI